jgi:hypothetical protein
MRAPTPVTFRWYLLTAALGACCLASSAQADPLGDLRNHLRQLNGAEPLKAQLEFENHRRDGDDKNPKISDGKVAAVAEESASGLSLQWGQALLQQAAEEIRIHRNDPEQPTPTRDAMNDLSAYDVQRYFNGAQDLLFSLNDATLLDERSDTLDGKPAHLLDFALKPSVSEHDRKYLKHLDVTCKVWLDADGVPLAMEQHYKASGSVMLVIGFETEDRDEFRYAHIGNRLVATRRVHENNSSGGGEHGQSRQVTTLHYEAGEALART